MRSGRAETRLLRFRLQFAEGTRDGAAGCTDSGQQATNETHGESEDDTLYKQFGRDLEGEGKVGKSLKIHRACGQAVERENAGGTDGAADEGNQERFNEEGKNDGRAAKPQGAHGGDFASTFSHGGIHGIQRAENSTDGHDQGDEPAQNGDELGHAGGLFRVVVDFASYVDIQTRIGGERVLQLLKGGRRSKVHGNGLGQIVRTVIGAVKKVGVAPNFGIKGTATRIENAHDLPTCATEPNGASQSQARIGRLGVFTDDEFGQTRLEHAAVNDFDIAADGKDVRRDTTKLNVGVGAGGKQ